MVLHPAKRSRPFLAVWTYPTTVKDQSLLTRAPTKSHLDSHLDMGERAED